MQDTSSGAASSVAPPGDGGLAHGDEGPIDHASPCTPPDQVAREGREEPAQSFPLPLHSTFNNFSGEGGGP